MSNASPLFGEPLLIPAHDPNILDLIDMYAISIKPNQCSTLLSRLSSHPFPTSLSHVKRIRKHTGTELHFLLHPVNTSDTIDEECELQQDFNPNGDNPSTRDTMLQSPTSSHLFQNLPQPIAIAIQDIYEDIFIVQVPRYPPHKKEDQSSWSRSYWPVSLHAPHRHVIKEKEDHANADTSILTQHMQHIWNVSLSSTTNSTSDGNNEVRNRNVCILVDPETNQIRATGFNQTEKHPLQHAVMVAIENVAEWQRKTWYSTSDIHTQQQHGGSENKNNEINNEDDEDFDTRINKNKKFKRDTLNSDTIYIKEKQIDFDSRPYLCTGYDCYVLHEPCCMCAMALVHSRVRRVIFCIEDKKGGVLGGSGVKLHSKRSLNHHYAAYHIPPIKN